MSWLARVSVNVRELRLFYNPELASNSGASRFLTTYYEQLKRLNPGLAMIIRPFGSIDRAKLTARYDYGGLVDRDITDMDEHQIKEQLRQMVEIGEVSLKADLYPWQEGYKHKMEDCIDFDPHDPDQQHIV